MSRQVIPLKGWSDSWNRYPHVFLRFIEGFFPTLEAGLKDGSVDFYAGPRPEGTIPEGLVVETLFNHDLSIVCRSGHPLSCRAGLRVSRPARLGVRPPYVCAFGQRARRRIASGRRSPPNPPARSD
jgi:DNA-binding transcriptional LysR family regulator